VEEEPLRRRISRFVDVETNDDIAYKDWGEQPLPDDDDEDEDYVFDEELWDSEDENDEDFDIEDYDEEDDEDYSVDNDDIEITD